MATLMHMMSPTQRCSTAAVTPATTAAAAAAASGGQGSSTRAFQSLGLRRRAAAARACGAWQLAAPLGLRTARRPPSLSTQAERSDARRRTAGSGVVQCAQRNDKSSSSSGGDGGGGGDTGSEEGEFERALLQKQHSELAQRIASGEFTVASRRVDRFGEVRRVLARTGGAPGRSAAMVMATLERRLRALAKLQMPEARGDVRAIIGQPFFVPLYALFLVYGGVFRLSFGPKQFAIVSDPVVAKHILKDNAKAYSKGILSEILDFVMGTGLIPADGEIWRVRRRAIVPALHRKYVEAMITLFNDSSMRLCSKLQAACDSPTSSSPPSHSEAHSQLNVSATTATSSSGGGGGSGDGTGSGVVEMESLFSRMTLDVIGKAVFNYEFDSLSKDKGIVEAVYVTLREAEARSTALFPYWKIPPLRAVLPGQRRVAAALRLINTTLDELIATCKRMVEEEDEEFYDEYVNKADPSILRFLLASGDDVSSKQLRDDLMTMLIAGHETSAAVLTWSFHLLAQHPEVTAKLQEEVDSVIGDRMPGLEDLKRLRYTTRIINEAMRLYPQPPVLIRRALEDDVLGGYPITKGQDIFISVWNLHRCPEHWEKAEEFWPERWGLDQPDPNEVTENFSYLPFGGGPRKCVGDIFALYEVIICTALLARRFTFELPPGADPVGMTTGATIHTTNGLLMLVKPRSHNNPSHSTGNGAVAHGAVAVAPAAVPAVVAAASASVVAADAAEGADVRAPVAPA